MYKGRLYIIRTENELTQQQLADKLGINRTNYCKYERGLRIPAKFDFWIKLANYYGVSVGYLMGYGISRMQYLLLLKQEYKKKGSLRTLIDKYIRDNGIDINFETISFDTFVKNFPCLDIRTYSASVIEEYTNKDYIEWSINQLDDYLFGTPIYTYYKSGNLNKQIKYFSKQFPYDCKLLPNDELDKKIDSLIADLKDFKDHIHLLPENTKVRK